MGTRADSPWPHSPGTPKSILVPPLPYCNLIITYSLTHFRTISRSLILFSCAREISFSFSCARNFAETHGREGRRCVYVTHGKLKFIFILAQIHLTR
jgi:hypothetical protein